VPRPDAPFLKSAVLAALLLVGADGVAFAERPAAAPPPPPPAPDQRLKELEKALEKGQAEREQIRQKAESQAKELEQLKSDMVQAARAVQEHEESLSELELQLADLDSIEKEKTRALDLKRQQLNGVLTALQRLAFRPSEALMAQPTSPADTVRSAILLRNITPRIQQSTKELRADLDSLTSLRSDISRQRQKISATTADLDTQHRKLAALFDRKSQMQQETESQQRETDKRLQSMAAEAQDLRDLMVRLEQERIRREREAAEKAAAEKAAREAEQAAARAAAKAAREAQIAAAKAAHEAELAAAKAAKEKKQAEEAAAKQARETAEAAQAAADKASRDAAAAEAKDKAKDNGSLRLFSKAQGDMPFPARGNVVVKFGQTDEAGLPAKGISIETRPDAQVIAPYDGQVVFAGPFRGYGLLLIIEHAEGYHTLLSGMSRIDGKVGQRLMSGEPVGVMGQSDSKPLLYVELRHNGQPVNPLPWLTARKTKVSG